jgi:hypothetical protein
MRTVRDLHHEAMELTQQAMIERHSGHPERARELSRRAYQLEAEAAELVPYGQASEPTRSILYRSAASLAYQCEELEATQRLAAKGLSGYPAADVRAELSDLLARVNFDLYLQSHGMKLENEEVQMGMTGGAVGLGVVLYREFQHRVEHFFRLVTKNVQRIMAREYQSGGPVAQIYKTFVPAIAALREGSFIVTLRFSRSQDVYQLPLLADTSEVIDEVLAGIEMVNNGDERELRERFGDDSYYYHFVSSTREIAPDGERIRTVNFSSPSRHVRLTRESQSIALIEQLLDVTGETELPIERVTGQLYSATLDRGVRLKPEEGPTYQVIVQEGLEELVRSYFGKWVEVVGPSGNRRIHLQDFRPVDRDDE